MGYKKLISTIYLKNGKAVKNARHTEEELDVDVLELSKQYNDSGIDGMIVFDLSDSDAEHEKNLGTLKDICHALEVPVYAGGHVLRGEDIKKILYAGCAKAILDSKNPQTPRLLKEGAARFGREKIIVSLEDVDILFKQRETLNEYVSGLLVLDERIIDSVKNTTELSMIAAVQKQPFEEIVKLLSDEQIAGTSVDYLDEQEIDVMEYKHNLQQAGIEVNTLTPAITWSELKLNSDGMIPVIAQDYLTNEVLMLAYMNEEAFEKTLQCGKMTYYSRSRQELWTKGMTSGHFQYVKSLTADCDNDTLLAKVSQIGAACHTGSPTCFFNEIVKKDYIRRNPLLVFEEVYDTIMDRKMHPKEGSYTNYLFDKGIDKILKKVGEEATEIVIAAKNPDKEEIKYEISDFLYHVMVLMAEKDVTWEDITRELAHRE
jgi:phosphoribosyl-ATP pyrophosphohydrolase/phosphoribosyl-AMP cyclohydrolase